jgi:serine/threonine protein kinase
MPSDPQNESATLVHTSLAAASLVGSTLNSRYLIERELQRGGFGIVYLARDLQLHSRPVVIKVLLEDAYKSEYVVQKFRQEMEALSRIDHPGVIGIIDSGELSDGKPFIAMQYVDGSTLRSLMKPEGMDLEKSADIIRQIGRALTAAHDKGIFHRDLKPENVMLQELGHGEQQVKVIDFGIAKIKDSLVAPNTDTNISAGTVSYMAPEQLSGRPVSAATDVFSLAEIAYEMLTGRKPFNPETTFELLEMQRSGVRISPTDLRPSLSAAAQAAIIKALSFEPNNRYARARDFGDDLARALTSGPLTSESVSKQTAEPQATQLSNELTPLAQKPGVRGEKTVGAIFPMVQSVADSRDASDRRQISARSKRGPGLLAGVLLLLLLIGGGYLYKRNVGSSSATTTNTRAPSERNVSYWLTVQKMHDGRPEQDEFESSGREIFGNGWKFIMNISSPEAGYLYLLNEGPAAGGTTALNVLFPAPSTNSGASYVAANQQIKTGWIQFDENQGTEKFWLVWAASPVPELEAVKGAVNEKDKGTINDRNQATAVRDLLTSSYASSKPEVKKDNLKKQTNVKAKGDVVVSFVELEHH